MKRIIIVALIVVIIVGISTFLILKQRETSNEYNSINSGSFNMDDPIVFIDNQIYLQYEGSKKNRNAVAQLLNTIAGQYEAKVDHLVLVEFKGDGTDIIISTDLGISDANVIKEIAKVIRKMSNYIYNVEFTYDEYGYINKAIIVINGNGKNPNQLLQDIKNIVEHPELVVNLSGDEETNNNQTMVEFLSGETSNELVVNETPKEPEKILLIDQLSNEDLSYDSGDNSQEDFEKFRKEFAAYADSVALESLNVKSSNALKNQLLNNAQLNYMAANGFEDALEENTGIAGFGIPVGYVLTNYNTKTSEDTYKYVLQNILGISVDKENGKYLFGTTTHVPVYVINDGAINGYNKYGSNLDDGSAAYEFYGDANGKEYHFITSDGQVFTLPGFPVMQSDGTIEYHIDSNLEHYYVVTGESSLYIGDKNVNNDVVTNTESILASYLKGTCGFDSRNGNQLGDEINGGGLAEKMIKIGE